MLKTNIAGTLIQQRLSDAEYIKHLEEQIVTLDTRIEQFINAVDIACFQRDPQKVMEAYTENVKLLRL